MSNEPDAEDTHTMDDDHLIGVETAYGTLRRMKLDSENGEIDFVGIELGFGTSHKSTHINHPEGFPLPKGKPCSGCRWTDARIIYSGTHDQYLVQTVGCTDIDGESDHFKTVWTTEPSKVLKLLLVPPPKWSDRPRNALELPPANREALTNAASVDHELGILLDDWLEVTRSGGTFIGPDGD